MRIGFEGCFFGILLVYESRMNNEGKLVPTVWF